MSPAAPHRRIQIAAGGQASQEITPDPISRQHRHYPQHHTGHPVGVVGLSSLHRQQQRRRATPGGRLRVVLVIRPLRRQL
jgi:hypothetical protein